MTSTDQPPHQALRGLIESIAEGNRDALQRLYEKEKNRLFGMVLGQVRSRDIAEDVLTDTFVRVWHKAETFRPERGEPSQWLNTIARRQAIDALRARGRDRLRFQDDPLGDELPSEEDDPVDSEVIRERAQMVRAAVDALSPTERSAIRAVFFEGRSHAQAALSLGAPLGTLKSRVRGALSRLAERLPNIDGEEEGVA